MTYLTELPLSYLLDFGYCFLLTLFSGVNICQPTYVSSANNGKHSDVVWQVKWANDSLEGYLNFYSISADGHVLHWTLVKTNLVSMEILAISFNRTLINLDESMNDYKMLDGGRLVLSVYQY